MFELPIPEDIYDFDSFGLRDILEKIEKGLSELEGTADKPKEVLSWIKKAKKIHGMISLELEERKAVEEFEDFCQKGEDFLKGLERYNPYSKQENNSPNKDKSDIIKQIASTPVKLEHSQISTAEESSPSRHLMESTERSNDTNSEFHERRSISNISEEHASRIYNKMHHANNKNKNKKKNALFDFMKQTLEATRLTNDVMAIGKASVGENTTKKTQNVEEERKEMQRRNKPSISETGSDQRRGNSKPQVNRPLQKPDPRFNMADTKIAGELAIGGFPKPQKTVIFKKSSESQSNKPKEGKKKKDSSLTDIDSKSEDKSNKKITRSKTTEEDSTPTTKPKSNKASISEGPKISSVNKEGHSKPPVPKQKSNIGQKLENKSNTVNGKNQNESKTNTALTKGKETVGANLGEKIQQKGKSEVEEKMTEKSISKKGSIQIGNEIEEVNENEEEEEEIKENNQDENHKEKKSVDKEEHAKANQRASLPDLERDYLQVSEETPKHSQSQVLEDYPKTNENILRNKLTDSENVTQTHDEEGYESNSEQVKEESDKGPSLSELENVNEQMKKVEIKMSHQIEEEDKETASISQVEQKSRNRSTASTTDEQSREETKGSTHQTTFEKQEKLRHIIESTKPQFKDQSSNEYSQVLSKKTEERIPASKDEEKYIEIEKDSAQESVNSSIQNLRGSKMTSSSTHTGDNALYLDYHKPGYYHGGNKNVYAKEENYSEGLGEKDSDVDLRSSLTSTKSAKERTVSSPNSLPQIETKSKEKKNSNVSPVKAKTVLPAIDGNKMMFAGEESRESASKQKRLNETVSPRKEAKRLSNVSSPSSNATRSSQKDQENNSMQKTSEKKSGIEGKKVENQLKEVSQTRSNRPINTTKTVASKVQKGADFPQIPESEIVDYSDFFTSFQDLFSGSWINGNNFDYLGAMRDFHHMFTVHTGLVDNMDTMLSKYKPSIAPLEFGPNDLIAQNNVNHILMYSTKTNIDLRKYMERQQVFYKNVSLIKYGEDPDDSEKPPAPKDTLYYRVVKTKTEVYDIITRSFLRKRNWVELPHGANLRTTWNLLWTWGKPQIDMNKLLVFQKVNHFPGNKGIVRKDLLKSNLERVQKLGRKAAEAFNILPDTFTLPKEITKFIEVFYEAHEREGPLNIWIVKPVGKSRGRGISLMNDIAGLKYTETTVVQRYLKNPLLLNGYKFDMRIYVLVTSLDPLEVYVYKEGFARLSTVPFNLDVEDLDNLFIHLTNSSVQKNSGATDNMSSDTIVGGTKISLKTLRQRLERKGISWLQIWNQVHEIIAKSLLACQNDIAHHPNAFELFGYDIIIDSNLKCWLLEVNSSPSLERMNILDDLVKQQLIDDTIDLVAPTQFDRSRLVQILERRILEEQRHKSSINTMNNSQVQLNKDLTYILHGKKLKSPEELPENLGNYERVAPTEMSDRFQKLIQSYKVQYKNPMHHDKKN